MSTLPGGPADKAGNIHEALWGVVGMVSVLGGQADAIRIEEPGSHGAEFYLEKATGKEHWQAKRQILGQKTWSLQRLSQEGILNFFKQRIDTGDSCVFASISDAPELRCLAENASDARNWLEFESKFLLATDRRKHFDELHKHLGYATAQSSFDFLRKARVEGARESTIEALLLPLFRSAFTGSPLTVLSVLSDLYIKSIHKRLSEKDILQCLASDHGIKPRTLNVSAELGDLVQGITEAYIAGQKAKLINGKIIPRKTPANIVQKILESEDSTDTLITSSAGGGKSAGLLQIITELIAKGIPVLAFRLDQVEPVASTELLGKELGLPESPAVVISQCHKGEEVVIVIDQLDSVSATSGRNPDFFEVVAAMAEEIRGLRMAQKIHLITACRQFDFQNDNRIRRLLPSKETPINIGPLSDVEVKSVIFCASGDPGWLTVKQLDLLNLPQNLSLFLEAGLANEQQPAFVTQKELLDAYWDCKRRGISRRRPKESAMWTQVLSKLTNEMSDRQELSVTKTRMDEYPPELLCAMVSEGVLNFNGQRYGFGHESLFDYCFARQAAAGDKEFVEVLEGDEQQLFRRAQLRQVLVYLRDDDLQRYLRNIQRALESDKIRPHLKLLVLELVAAFTDPRIEELNLLMPFLEQELKSQRECVTNSNKTASLAWAAFFGSAPLFYLADKEKHLERWLYSGDDCLENSMTFYLRSQMRYHSERVAELLEPFAGKGGKWSDRLRFVMQWADLSGSRRIFDLFLQLLDDGTLDDARGPIAVNSTFWSLVHGLAAKQPTWCADVAARWLSRKIAIAQASKVEGGFPKLHDPFGVDEVLECARLAPKYFLEVVLQTLLKAAEAFAYGDKGVLRQDSIWSYRLTGLHVGMEDSYPKGCEIALELLGSSDPEELRIFVELLRRSQLYISNQLLLSAYAKVPEIYAEEALLLLVEEPERLDCGLPAKNVIQKCSDYVTDETFERLEEMLINYKTEHERSRQGFRHQGYSAYELTSVLSPCRLNVNTKRRLAEWYRKFGPTTPEPAEIECSFIPSPISHDAASHMTDGQWLRAIGKYSAASGVRYRSRALIGGAEQLAQVLKEFVKRDPERFAALSLHFPPGSNSSFQMNVLYGLNEAPVNSVLKIEVSRRVFDSKDNACLMAALDLLGSIKDVTLPDDTIQFIVLMATVHSHPEADKHDDRDPVQHGINTVRGHGASAIRNLILSNKIYLEIFRAAIERCISDPCIAVRACAVSTLLAVAVHDERTALNFFIPLLQTDDIILKSHYAENFIARGLREHIDDLLPIIERMLLSIRDDVRQVGGRLVCLARLYHPQLDHLAGLAISGDFAARLGAAEVAKSNLTNAACRPWCESTLMHFFDDENDSVRLRAAGCFWHLWHQPDIPLGEYDELIQSFLKSQAFTEEPTFLINALKDTRQRVPETILEVCDVFVTKCANQAKDIRTSYAADETTVGKLVFRAYAQLGTHPLRLRALGLIDHMCAEGLQSAGKNLTDFER